MRVPIASSQSETGKIAFPLRDRLSFLWLVVGLLQQGQELHLQYEELTKTVEHSSKQAAAQQGHEKHMRQSVLNETRQIFERDLASIAVEAIGRRQIPNKVAAALGAADYNNVCSKIASFLSHDNHTGYIDLNRKENSFDEDYYEEQAQLAKFSEERYLDCYQHGLKCLVALEGSEYYEKYYKNSPFYSLYELFCMDIEANDKLTNPQDSEPS